MDDFKPMGESITAARLRTQEEMFQKASAALFDEVSDIRSSVLKTTPTHLFIL